jgi:PAS domain-containing protein
MGAAPDDLSIFNIFAARARTELERQQAEEALKRSEERLSSVLTSAMDAIIIIDDKPMSSGNGPTVSFCRRRMAPTRTIG